MADVFTYGPGGPDSNSDGAHTTIAITNINCGASHLVKINKDVYIPAGMIQSIMDYHSSYAATQVRCGKKKGIVLNLATVDKPNGKDEEPNTNKSRKKYKRASVQCVIFLINGTIAVTATSTATIIKRYEDAINGVSLVSAKNQA